MGSSDFTIDWKGLSTMFNKIVNTKRYYDIYGNVKVTKENPMYKTGFNLDSSGSAFTSYIKNMQIFKEQ